MNHEPVPRELLTIINRLFSLQLSADRHDTPEPVQRGIRRMRDAFEEYGLNWEDPMGQPFNETRTDLEARIAGTGSENLRVTEVIKPIIRRIVNDGPKVQSEIVQPGLVVVESKSEEPEHEQHD